MTTPVPQPLDDASTPEDRRQRLRLRELCDEVIASRRVESEQDVLSPDERAEARSLLAEIAPRVGRRERAR